jgi:HAD superfamily hydrolase (TIGR01549 family)
MLKAVIFDVDGTLVDSVDLHALCWQEAFLSYGKHVDFEEVRHQIGKGSDQLLPVFFSKRELKEFGGALDERRKDMWKRDYAPRVKPFPKVRELFERIREDGREIALASSAKEDELAAYMDMLHIKDLISDKTTSDDAEKSKPHPDIFQAALDRLGDPPVSQAMAVGDTPYDAQAAAKIGLRTFGVLCGGFPEFELRRAKCIAVYLDPADLLARYDDSPLATAWHKAA